MRETKILTTPNERKVEVYEYITAKDQRAYQTVLYGLAKLNMDGGLQPNGQVVPKIEEIPASILLDLDKMMCETLVVSVDGVKENIFDLISEFKVDDYNYLIGELRGFFRTE